VRAGWLGLQVQEVTPEMSEAMALPKPATPIDPEGNVAGLIVTSVEPGEAAAKVGIRPGDVLYSYNGQPVAEPRALMRRIGRTDIGTTADLTLWRDGKMITQPIVVEEWPAEENPPPIKPMVTVYEASLGLSLQPMLQSTDGTPARTNSVEVTAVAQESVAMYGGVQVGDVIAMVLDAPVTQPGEVFGAFAQARKAGRKFVSLLIRRDGVPHWTTLPL
jgi:serine protease Do